MTIVRVQITEDKMTSTIEGTGTQELKEVVDKLGAGDYQWTLTIKSEASLKGK